MPRDIHFSELLKGSSIAFIIRILGIISGYIFTLIIARVYGAKTMGIFTLSLTLLQISSVIGKLGMDIALLRFVAEYASCGKWYIVKDIYTKAIKIILPFSFILSLAVFFLSGYIAKFIFKKSYLTPYFKGISLGIVPLVLLFIHTESLRGLKKIKEYTFFQQAAVFMIASVILSVVVLLYSYNLLPLVNNLNFVNIIPIIIYIFSIFIVSVIVYLVWKKHINIFSSEPSGISYRTILKVSIPLFFSNSLLFIMGLTDTIMLGIFRTAQEVGIYNVAFKVSMIATLTLTAINTIAAPKFAEFWGKKDIKGLARVAQQSTRLIFWTSFPVLLLFLIFPKSIMGLFGEEFKAGARALMVLTIGQFVNAFCGSVGYILQMTGKEIFFSSIMFFSYLLNISLNIFFIPKFGIYGASLASMISVVFWNFTFLIYIKLTYKFWTFKLGD